MSSYPTLIHERVALAQAGDNPWVITQMSAGWAVMGDQQFLPGYCLLLPDPVVGRLTDLDESARGSFLLDMSRIGAALLAVTAADRINYEILGNSEPALHAHVFPRYASESTEYRNGPVWLYPPEQLESQPFHVAEHEPLRQAIAAALRDLAAG